VLLEECFTAGMGNEGMNGRESFSFSIGELENARIGELENWRKAKDGMIEIN